MGFCKLTFFMYFFSWIKRIIFVYLPLKSGLNKTTMKLAFLISVQKDACHLRDLVNSLPSDADYFIHVDLNCDLHHFKRLLQGDNIHFVSHRVRIVSGSISEVEAQVALIRSALVFGADRLIMIGGLDYPLWSNNRIEDFFSTVGDKQIVCGVAMPGQGRAAYRYTDFQLFNNHAWSSGSFKNRVRRFAKLVLSGSHVHKTLRVHCQNKTYTLYKGGTSWAITQELGKLIVREWDDNKQMRTYFSTSYCPVETFVPTVAFNSIFAPNCMLVKGKRTEARFLMPLTYLDARISAKVLTEVDFRSVCDCDRMFVRQVVSDYSDGLKSMIDARRKG